jgi:hypothetical protein
MATSILDIQVNDESFKGFMELYGKYQESLSKLPGAWQDVNKATSANGVTIGELAAAMLTQNELLRETVDSHKDIEKAASRVDGVMGSINTKVASAAKSAAHVTLELVKWSAIAGAAFAGLGFGSLFGIDKLASSASQISHGARGLGVDPAAQQAFRVNYGQYVASPDAMLSNTAEMQADQTKWGAFMAAGISAQELQNDDPEELSRRVIDRTKALYDQAGPNGRTAQFMQAHGLDQLLPGGLQDFKRIGGASREELDQAGRDEQRDRRAFALDPKALKAWTEFTNQMHRAGTTMEDVLIGKLAPLAGPLTELSKSITTAITSLLSNPDLGNWITALGHGIEEFATYLTSPQFKEDFQAAEDEFHKFVVAMGNLIERIERWFDPDTGKAVPGAPEMTQTPLGPVGILPAPQANESWWDRLTGNIGHAPWNMPKQPMLDNHGNPITPGIDAWRSSATQAPSAAIAGLEKAAADKYGVPPDLQRAIYAQEHGLLPDGSPAISPTGAIGIGQLMPTTAQGLGVNPYDTSQNIDGSTRYMRQLLDQFGGDQLAAAAAYNAGPNNAGVKQYAASGDTDESGLPSETRKYVHAMVQKYGLSAHPVEQEEPLPRPGSSGKQLVDALRAMSRGRSSGANVQITVQDATGSNITVSASQLAH